MGEHCALTQPVGRLAKNKLVRGSEVWELSCENTKASAMGALSQWQSVMCGKCAHNHNQS